MTCQALGIDDLLAFEFVSPPSREAIVSALEQLYNLGALDNTGKVRPTAYSTARCFITRRMRAEADQLRAVLRIF